MTTLKPYPWKCASCRERAVAPVTLASYAASLEHDGKAYEVELHNLPVLRCGHCGEVVFGDEAEMRLSDALRDAAGLLHPAEIRGRRESLGLTQKQLARRLRIAESTLSRWETGAQIQQKCMDLMLRSFFDLPELRRYLDAIELATLPA
jgi:putative zinc finger/helix-turn-helix YgiT family protein